MPYGGKFQFQTLQRLVSIQCFLPSLKLLNIAEFCGGAAVPRPKANDNPPLRLLPLEPSPSSLPFKPLYVCSTSALFSTSPPRRLVRGSRPIADVPSAQALEEFNAAPVGAASETPRQHTPYLTSHLCPVCMYVLPCSFSDIEHMQLLFYARP